MPEGEITSLYGPGGAGKTTLVMQLCRDIARGEPLFGMIPTQRIPCVCVGCEESDDDLWRLFHKQGVRADDAISYKSLKGWVNTALHPSFKASASGDTPAFRVIADKLASMPSGPNFLALDNLAHFYHGNYFEPAEIANLLNGYLARFEREFNATVLLMAHPSEGQRANGDGSYGGIGWSAGVRSRLYFERHMSKPLRKGDKPQPIGRERVLSRKKANFADDGGERIVDWTATGFVPVAKPSLFGTAATGSGPASEQIAPDMLDAAVKAVLKSNPAKPWTQSEMADKIAHEHIEGVELGSQSLRKTYLTALREKAGTEANRCYISDRKIYLWYSAGPARERSNETPRPTAPQTKTDGPFTRCHPSQADGPR
jgi:hypothetical protein